MFQAQVPYARFKHKGSMSVFTTWSRLTPGFLRIFTCTSNTLCSHTRQLHVGAVSSIFAKELFVGNFTKKEVFPYTEVSDDQQETIQMMIEPIQKFFAEKVDSAKIDKEATISKEVLDGLKELGLFGLQIPEEYSGLGLSNTNYARVLETFCEDPAIAVTLMAHQSIGLKGILIVGTDEQKTKYLPKLAVGEEMAAFCLTEPSSGSDAASIQSRATLSSDGKHYLLNGNKIWISNGGWADVFTVFARTYVTNEKGETKDKITAFIVERAFGGITNGQPEDKMGIRGSNTCEVNFDNTPVPVENVLGEVGGGFKVAMTILNSGRFGMGAVAAGGIRKLIEYSSEYATQREQFQQKLSTFGQIQEKFARMAITAYTIESMAYLTSGMVDRGEDCSLEAAMCKIYGSEGVWDSVNEALQTLGGLGYMRAFPYERILRDTRIMMIFEGTNEILRMYIALTGMQYAGENLQKLIKAIKSPFANRGLLMNTLFKRAKYSIGIKNKLNIEDGVDSKLKTGAKQLEENVVDFGVTSEKLLRKYKKTIVDEQLLLKRMSNVAIDMFGMTAVLSRATRTITKGDANADYEVLLATTFCNEAYFRNKAALREVNQGTIKNGDINLVKIAAGVFEGNSHVPRHPLTL